MGHVESPYEEGIKRLKDYHEVPCSISDLNVLTNHFDWPHSLRFWQRTLQWGAAIRRLE
jgi:hypothetical protein